VSALTDSTGYAVGSLLVMSEWVTHREAAEILGVHVSLIPKMLHRGDLTSRRERPSLRRADVEALRERRAQPKPQRQPRGTPRPPDDRHEWLLAREAGAVMGVGPEAVKIRARRGRLPSELHDGRRWFRRDHLELVKRADAVKRGAGDSLMR
jgi:hypothetical protein